MALFPRAPEFFAYFEKHIEKTSEGVGLLEELLGDLGRSGQKAHRIKEVEHEGDVVAHEAMASLHKTFITPFDREAIHRLMSGLDDILDQIEATAERLTLYEVDVPRPEAFEQVRILHKAVDQLKVGLHGIRDVRRSAKEILAVCVEVNRLENEADEVLRQALARLFREERDALLVLKWKEVFEALEEALDRCEDVADILEGVVLENA
jgi:predicted phosphate transport protein (TIGR00153 family)